MRNGGCALTQTFSGYLDLRKNLFFTSRAMARTKLAVEMAAVDVNAESSKEADYRIWSWLILNHIVQSWYIPEGIDVRPLSIGGMYGYGWAIGRYGTEEREPLEDLAWLATASVRVDPRGERCEPSFGVKAAISQGADPFVVLLRGAKHAVGDLSGDPRSGSYLPDPKKAEVYLTLFQIIALLVASRVLDHAILGEFVGCSEWGFDPSAKEHLLVRLGVVPGPEFYGDLFALNFSDGRGKVWIHRGTGQLVLERTGERFPFAAWCGGSVERGFRFLLENA